MNRRYRLKLVVAVLYAVAFSCVAATDARAQGFISPLIGYNFGGDAQCVSVRECEEKNLNVGVAFGVMGSIVGFEQEFAYANDFFGKAPGVSSNVLTLMSSFMVVPKIGPVRPYGLIGLGLIKSHVELTAASLLETDNNNFGWNIGGGVMVLFGEHVGVRGDLRYFHAFQDFEVLGVSLGSDKLDFGRAAGALVLAF
jgi:opacity protein-like surface antigen